MKLLIDITEREYDIWTDEDMPYMLVDKLQNGKLMQETTIYDDDGIGHKVYKEV